MSSFGFVALEAIASCTAGDGWPGSVTNGAVLMV